MPDTINGRTPEEIKRGLECCSVDGLSCSNCSYCVSCDADIHALECDALAYIQQLENHIGELTEMVQQLERERDAAVEQLRKGGRACSTCKFSEDIPENDKICEECRLTGTKLLYSNWEWVGPQEVE